jgi:N-carbamoylputrescine amidase
VTVAKPMSFFKKAGNVTFNTAAIIDADGAIHGNYRKAPIPYGHSYEEKFYYFYRFY